MKEEDYNMGEDEGSEELFSELIIRFEKMISQGENVFFDSDDLLDIIDYYMLSENKKNAKIAIESGLAQYPSNVLFKVCHARYLIMLGENTKAKKVLKQIEKENSNDADVLLALAEFYSYEKKHSDAAKYFELALKLIDEEDKFSIIENLIDEYESIGQHKKMIPHLKKMIQLEFNSVEAMNQLSFCYTILGKEDEGIEYFSGLIETSPFNVLAWFNLGNLFYSLELFEKAIDAYEYVLAIEPEYVTAGVKMATALISIEKNQEAISVLESILKYDPHEASIYNILGTCYSELKEYKIAEKYYKDALKLQPDLLEASLGLVYVYVRQDNFKSAHKQIKKITKLIIEISEIWFLKAFIETNLELYDEALDSIIHGLEYKPEDFAARIILAEIFTGHYSDYESAIHVLNEGLLIDPENVVLLYTLAAIYLEAGMIYEAKNQLHEALSTDREKLYILYDYNPSLQNHEVVIEISKHYF